MDIVGVVGGTYQQRAQFIDVLSAEYGYRQAEVFASRGTPMLLGPISTGWVMDAQDVPECAELCYDKGLLVGLFGGDLPAIEPHETLVWPEERDAQVGLVDSLAAPQGGHIEVALDFAPGDGLDRLAAVEGY